MLKRMLSAQDENADTTFGVWEEEGKGICFTLEDVVREVSGQPVSSWKVKGKTAIPVGRYKLTLENSARFGAKTITLNDVPGFEYIRVHGGNSSDSTEGCIIVGDQIDARKGEICGAKARGVLQKVKDAVEYAITADGECYLTVSNK